MKMIEKSVAVKGDTFIEGPGGAVFSAQSNDSNKAIIYYHGWSSSVERSLFRGQILAMYGHTVFLPSIPLHDWREPVETTDRNMALYFWRCVEEAVKEFVDLAEFIRDFYGIEKRNIAVTGHSMGGYIAGGVLLHEPEIHCGVIYNASMDWEHTQKHFQSCAKGIENLRFEDCASYRINPINHLDAFYDKSILLANGSEDSVVPKKGNELFMQALKSKKLNKRLLQHTYPGVGHVVTDQMLQDGLTFIDENL